MQLLSTGDEPTLGNYLKLCHAFFGEDSKATAFIRDKIAESSKGESELVIASEQQMLMLLGTMALESNKGA
ncbi:hypothetical protein ACPV5S_15590 [Vibrio astriarenae]